MNILPTTLPMTCGQFNGPDVSVAHIEDNTKEDVLDIANIGNKELFNSTINDISTKNTEKTNKLKTKIINLPKIKIYPQNQVSVSNSTTSPIMAQSQIHQQQDPLFQFSVEDLNLLMTPLTEKILLSFNNETNKNSDSHQQESNVENWLLDDEITAQNLQFDSNFAFNLLEEEEDKKHISDSAKIDHAYVPFTELEMGSKRCYSDESGEFAFSDDTFSMQSESTNTNSTNPPSAKKRRTRGIYRLEDVKTSEELINYQERRRKNNISSKNSRASKKRQYHEMEYKANELEKANEELNKKIKSYEEIVKLTKEWLLQRLSKSE
jgi:hypothetical protein